MNERIFWHTGLLRRRVVQRHLYRVDLPFRHINALPRHLGLLWRYWVWHWGLDFHAVPRAATVGVAVASGDSSLSSPWSVSCVATVVLANSDSDSNIYSERQRNQLHVSYDHRESVRQCESNGYPQLERDSLNVCELDRHEFSECYCEFLVNPERVSDPELFELELAKWISECEPVAEPQCIDNDLPVDEPQFVWHSFTNDYAEHVSHAQLHPDAITVKLRVAHVNVFGVRHAEHKSVAEPVELAKFVFVSERLRHGLPVDDQQRDHFSHRHSVVLAKFLGDGVSVTIGYCVALDVRERVAAVHTFSIAAVHTFSIAEHKYDSDA